MTCLFCNIISGKIPASLIYEDEHIIAFDDIKPQAPYHKLIIPRRHIASLDKTKKQDKILLGHLVYTANDLAKNLGIQNSGYRLIINCNEDGGQEVFHIHLHLLGGRPMQWPPG